jgi:hypothetical protein
MKSFLCLIAVFAISIPALGQVDETDAGGFRIVERSEDYNQKWALVIGINYEGTEWELRNPENDASEVYYELKENKGFECQLLLGKEASRANILGALAKLYTRIGEDDCFLLYFAGHGNTQESCPVLYPADFDVNGTIVNAIRADEIVSERSKSRHSLYVFDSCYSGGIVDIPYKTLKRRQSDPTFDGRSIQILTAAADNQKAKDGDGEHSPFASAFMGAVGPEARVSATEIHRKISDRLRIQNSVFESFVPGRDTVAAGEFYFIGKPRVPPTKAFTYQTLGGSHLTLAGSPLSQTWFEETPWLIPALRLMLDSDMHGRPHLFPSESSVEPVHAQPTSSRALIEKAQKWLDTSPAIDSSVLEVYSKLKDLPLAKDKSAVIASTLKVMTTRSADMSSTDLHTLAILRCANLRYLEDSASDEATPQISDLFAKALAAYEREQRTGLLVRCLTDCANWHLGLKNFEEANKTYRQALSLLGELTEAELVRIELLAGAADASRRLAKDLLARGEAATEDDRIVAQQLWSDAYSYYQELKRFLDGRDFPEAHLAQAYLFERLAWLNMDHGNVIEAKQHFEKSLSLREKDEMDLVSFLCYANSGQGIAMIDQMTGSTGKENLLATKELVKKRLLQAGDGVSNLSLLYGRLCNTIERLGDCDFVAGREQLVESIGTYQDGLDVCAEWLPIAKAVGEREAKGVRSQRLRFLCKTVIAAAADNQQDRCSKYALDLKNERVRVEADRGILLVLCDFAEAFSNYCKSRKTCEGKSGCQSEINAIRTVVHRHSAASMDRETAELLLMASNFVVREQQRQDGIVLRELLPRDSNRNPPANMTRYVRQQYDRVLLLQGLSYSGQVEWQEYEGFRDLILSLQSDDWAPAEKRGPHVLFYFPIDGSKGLLLLSNGELENNGDEVWEIGFGWKDIGELNSGLKSRLSRLILDHPNAKLGWANDKFLFDAGFAAEQCPFLK